MLVGFDPANEKNAQTLAAFRLAYGVDGATTIRGPWNNSGTVPTKLDDGGGALRLQRPDSLHTKEDGDSFYPMLIEDTVNYDDEGGWPVLADGGGASLRRIDSAVYGDSSANWTGNAEPFSGITHALDFQQWADSAFPAGTPAADRLATADPDKDGLINFLEFASVLNPLQAQSARPLEASSDAGGFPILGYRQRNGTALRYSLSFSFDLIEWSDATPHTEIVSSTPAGDGLASVIKSRFQQSPPITNDGAVFFRLEITER